MPRSVAVHSVSARYLKKKTIFTVNTVVPPSFLTSFLPWFLNCDWQCGSVFPWTHPLLEHVKLPNGYKADVRAFFQNKCLFFFIIKNLPFERFNGADFLTWLTSCTFAVLDLLVNICQLQLLFSASVFLKLPKSWVFMIFMLVKANSILQVD